MKHITKDKLAEIIVLADKANPPHAPRFLSGADLLSMSSLKPSDEEIELRRALQALSKNEMCELMAVMWIGRGEHEPEAFDDLVKHASYSSDEGDICYVAGKSPLAKYLRDGLRNLGE